MSIVTCRTEGCTSQGVPIPMQLSYIDTAGETHTVDMVLCGACGQQITDIETNPEG